MAERLAASVEGHKGLTPAPAQFAALHHQSSRNASRRKEYPRFVKRFLATGKPSPLPCFTTSPAHSASVRKDQGEQGSPQGSLREGQNHGKTQRGTKRICFIPLCGFAWFCRLRGNFVIVSGRPAVALAVQAGIQGRPSLPTADYRVPLKALAIFFFSRRRYASF